MIQRDDAIGRRIVDDLRREADANNDRSMTPGTSPDLRRALRREHQYLRRLANRYESWLLDGLEADGRDVHHRDEVHT